MTCLHITVPTIDRQLNNIVPATFRTYWINVPLSTKSYFIQHSQYDSNCWYTSRCYWLTWLLFTSQFQFCVCTYSNAITYTNWPTTQITTACTAWASNGNWYMLIWLWWHKSGWHSSTEHDDWWYMTDCTPESMSLEADMCICLLPFNKCSAQKPMSVCTFRTVHCSTIL